MLGDRDYMRDPRGRGNPSDPVRNARGGFHALIAVIVLNIFCWIMDLKGLELYAPAVKEGEVWRLATSLFQHHDFFHLFFNMFSLYIFGSLIAPILGPKRFLLLYFVSGIAGNLLWMATSWSSFHVLIGASGAVMGIIIASAMMLPDIEMFLLFIPFPIKLRTMAIVFICIELFNQISVGTMSGIAYTAHIGGFIGGMLLMRSAFRRFVTWDPLAFLSGGNDPRRNPTGTQPPPKGWSVRDDRYSPPPPPPTGRVTRKELDTLLDKISLHGINSLSEEELARLRQAREQMRSGK